MGLMVSHPVKMKRSAPVGPHVSPASSHPQQCVLFRTSESIPALALDSEFLGEIPLSPFAHLKLEDRGPLSSIHTSSHLIPAANLQARHRQIHWSLEVVQFIMGWTGAEPRTANSRDHAVKKQIDNCVQENLLTFQVRAKLTP